MITDRVQGIRSEECFRDFVAELDPCKFDIMRMSETWRAENEEISGIVSILGGGFNACIGMANGEID